MYVITNVCSLEKGAIQQLRGQEEGEGSAKSPCLSSQGKKGGKGALNVHLHIILH